MNARGGNTAGSMSVWSALLKGVCMYVWRGSHITPTYLGTLRVVAGCTKGKDQNVRRQRK
jgi:hypothetical protein